MLGAAAGGLARYVVSTAVMQRFQGRFPLGTLVVNVTGCFLIGLLMTWFTERTGPHPHWRLLLVTGVLGGYTTFSSFAWETFESLNEGSIPNGFLNVAASTILGVLAVWCGVLLGRR
jgi:CrcB protein